MDILAIGIDGGQMLLLLGVFWRLGQVTASHRDHAARILRVEKTHDEIIRGGKPHIKEVKA